MVTRPPAVGSPKGCPCAMLRTPPQSLKLSLAHGADSSQARPALSLRLWPSRIVHKLLTLESASSRLAGSKRLKNSNQGLTSNPRRPAATETTVKVPEDIVARFHLQQVSHNEFERLFPQG